MEGDGKTRAAPPCRDNNKRCTQKTTSVREQVEKEKEEENEELDAEGG
jgi:hypothetical protein